jgi:hypothetical protein
MIYVWTASWKPGLSREQADGALMRRAQWQYPEGVKVHGEYWLASSSPAVVSIFEADTYAPIMELGMTWGDVFDITCTPAITPQEGLRQGPEIMQRRPA